MTATIIQEFRRTPAATGPHAHHGSVRNRAYHHWCRSLLPSHAIQWRFLHPGRHPEITAFETKESIDIDGAQLELTPGRTEGGSSIEYLVTSGTVTIAGQDLV